MKHTPYLVGLIVLVVAGVFLFRGEPENESDSELSAFEGQVSAVHLDGVALDGPAIVRVTSAAGEEVAIAIPSMGLRLCQAYGQIADAFAVSVGDRVSVAGARADDDRLVPCEGAEHYFRVETTVSDPSVELSFTYRKGPDGYVLDTPETSADADPSLITVFSLIRREDHERLGTQNDATEGPPSIAIAVFENVRKQSASVWTDRNPSLSNIGLLVGDVDRDAVVGGANAVRYMIDGLYRTHMAVVAHGGRIYLFSGAFLEEASAIRRDFQSLLDSVAFIPAR